MKTKKHSFKSPSHKFSASVDLAFDPDLDFHVLVNVGGHAQSFPASALVRMISCAALSLSPDHLRTIQKATGA